MNRRFQDSQLYADFRDLAVIILACDSIVGILAIVLWHIVFKVVSK